MAREPAGERGNLAAKLSRIVRPGQIYRRHDFVEWLLAMTRVEFCKGLYSFLTLSFYALILGMNYLISRLF